MSKGKTKIEEDANPFAGFNIMKGEFIPPVNDDIKTDNDEIVDEDKQDEDSEEKRMQKADEKLAKTASKIAKKQKTEVEQLVDEATGVEDEDEVDDKESPFKEFTKVLHNKGVIDFDDSDEDFDDSEEGLEKLVNKTVENRINKWVEALPEEYAKMLEFVQSGGTPKQFLDVYYGNHSWDNFSLDNESKQELAATESLRIAGETEEDIQDIVKEWRENGTLYKRANSALNKLKKYESQQKEELVESQKQKEARKKAEEKEYWDNFKKDLMSKEEIKGFKLTPKIKEKLWDHLTAVDKKTGKTAYQKAIESDKEASLLFALQSMNNFDISSLEKQVESRVTNKLGKVLKNYTKTTKERISSGSNEEHDDSNNPFAAFRTLK
jgi:hypothetical protein